MMTSQFEGADRVGERRYRHLFEHVPICIFVADMTVTPAIILEANQRAELVYGYTAAELAGMPAAYLVPEEARPAVQDILRRVQQGETVTAETTNQRRDCTRFPVRVTATPDPADEGRMIVTVEDITAEAQRRSESEAIDAERRRIAHEIHDGVAQSLAGLRFKLALWHHLADAAPPGMLAALDEVQAVLNAAIVGIRRAIFALRPVDLDALGFFPALAQLVGDFGDQNQMVARLEISGPQKALPAVYELPLFRVIQEGVNNIGQHARASSALVRLAVDPAGGVAVSVRDNGRGFDPSQLGPTDPVGHFGLRQMRERIVGLGGTLDIRSAPGQGTELVIALPPITQEANHGRTEGHTMPPIRILIADDHTLMRQGMRQLCEGMGGFVVVAEAEDGAQAVAMTRTAQPDVILMDIVMPDVDGVEAIRQIMREIPAARIIALTMYRQEQYMLDAIRAGARGYLLKTVDAQRSHRGHRGRASRRLPDRPPHRHPRAERVACGYAGIAADRAADGERDGRPAPCRSGRGKRAHRPGAELLRLHRGQPAADHLRKAACNQPHPGRAPRPAPGLGRAGRAAGVSVAGLSPSLFPSRSVLRPPQHLIVAKLPPK